MQRTIRLTLIGAALFALVGPAAAQKDLRGMITSRQMALVDASRGWVGLSFRPATGGAVVVDDVFDGSPAGRAGVQGGDTIVLWNGNRNVDDAVRRARLNPGDTIRIRVRRSGQRDRDLTLTATERPGALTLRDARPRDGNRNRDDGPIVITIPRRDFHVMTDSLVVRMDSLHQQLRTLMRDSLRVQLRGLEKIEIPDMRIEIDRMTRDLNANGALFGLGVAGRTLAGAELSPMNPGLASYFGTDKGLLVVRVAEETPAARSGLQAGDVVIEANDTEVRDVSDLRRIILRGRDAKEQGVKLEIVRKSKRRELQLKW
jgi:C-terminal processing protease CtpA/Prc